MRITRNGIEYTLTAEELNEVINRYCKQGGETSIDSAPNDHLKNDDTFSWKITRSRDGSYTKISDVVHKNFRFHCKYHSKLDYAELFCRMTIKPVYENGSRKNTVTPLAHCKIMDVSNETFRAAIMQWKKSSFCAIMVFTGISKYQSYVYHCKTGISPLSYSHQKRFSL